MEEEYVTVYKDEEEDFDELVQQWLDETPTFIQWLKMRKGHDISELKFNCHDDVYYLDFQCLWENYVKDYEDYGPINDNSLWEKNKADILPYMKGEKQ